MTCNGQTESAGGQKASIVSCRLLFKKLFLLEGVRCVAIPIEFLMNSNSRIQLSLSNDIIIDDVNCFGWA